MEWFNPFWSLTGNLAAKINGNRVRTETGFGSWLQRRRKAADLTQKELGQEVGCSTALIRKIEAGRRRPSKQVAALLAEILGIDEAQKEAFVAFARGEQETGFSSLESWPLNGAGGRPFFTPVHNIPLQATHFVNREVELTRLSDFMNDPAVRLVSIVGPGGIGKTRLALAYAEQFVTADSKTSDQDFQYLFFIDLAPVRDVADIITTLAQSLGFNLQEGKQDSRSYEQQIVDYLREKRMLLIFDNFEHLLDGAMLLVTILQNAPGVQILVTSRERLYLKVEQVYWISGLLFPERDLEQGELALARLEEYPAVQLFLQTARRNRMDFEPGGRDDLLSLVQICRLVDGMPLALELASAWVETLTLPKIAARISESLDFLNSKMRDLPKRHRSIRATIDISWLMLSGRERRVMGQLSVFRGRIDRRAAEEVCGASWQLLNRLVEKSLLQINEKHDRYYLHELLRQFSEAELLKAPLVEIETRNRHSEFYTTFLQQKDGEMKGAGQLSAVQQIGEMLENCKAAWSWAVQRRNIGEMCRALDGICGYFEWVGLFTEGQKVCEWAIESLREAYSSLETWLLIRILTWQASYFQYLNHQAKCEQLLEQSLILLNSLEFDDQITEREEAFFWLQQGQLASSREVNKQAYLKSLSSYQAINDKWGTAMALLGLGSWYWSETIYSKAKPYLLQSLALFEEVGDQRGKKRPLGVLAVLDKHLGNYDEALRSQQDLLLLVRQFRDRPAEAGVLSSLGYTLGNLSRFTEAVVLLDKSIQICNDLGLNSYRVYATITRCWITCLMGDYKETDAILKEMFDSHGYEAMKVHYVAFMTAGMCHLALGNYEKAESFLRVNVEVNSRSGSSWLVYICLAMMAIAAREQGNKLKAQEYLIDSLGNTIANKIAGPVRNILAAKALLLIDDGDTEGAVELYSLARNTYPLVEKSPFYNDIAGRQVDNAATALPKHILWAAVTRGKFRNIWITLEEILNELEKKA